MTVVFLCNRVTNIIAAISAVIFFGGLALDGVSWRLVAAATSPLEIYIWWRVMVAFWGELKLEVKNDRP